MLKQATLDVLARAAEIGLPEAAGVPASAHDPFLRPIIRKNVRRAIADASAATRSPRGDHVLRLAFLRAHPSAPAGIDPDDARAVADAFEALAKPYLPERPASTPAHVSAQGSAYRVSARDRDQDAIEAPPRPKRKPWPVTFSVLGMLVVSALVVAGVVIAPYALPSSLQRFARTPFGKALGEPLTDVVVASGAKGSPARRSQTRAAMSTPQIEKQIGAAAFADLDRLLDAIPEATRSPAESADDALRPLLDHVNALDAELAKAHVPALLHVYASGYPGKRSVWVTSYFVEDRSEVTIDDLTLRIARGRRLDELNLRDSALYKGDLEDWAIVSLDHIDEQLVQVLLTPLAKGTPMGPEEWRDTDRSPQAELARVASKLVASEVFAYAKLDAEAALTLHSAIARRNDAMVSMNKMGLDVEATSRIRLSPSLVRNLERWEGTSFERKLAGEVLRIDSRMKVYAKPLAPVIAELARIQEDQFAGRLAARKTKEAGADVMVSRHDAMLASMLAALSRPQPCPRLALWLDIRLANDAYAPWEDRHAAQKALMALFDALGTPAAGPDEPFAVRAKALLEAPPEKLREAAAKAHATELGRPPPVLSRKPL